MEVPPYSKRRIAVAGRDIAQHEGPYTDLVVEAAILEAWREAHNEVMVGVKAELASLVLENCPSAVVVSRLKRADAIVAKLQRRDISHKLSMLRDIAGCRVIVDSLDELEDLSSRIIQYFGVKSSDVKDYVAHAKDDGYRSRHFVVRRDTSQYDGLRCEIQLRTRLQHSWATAVEIYDVISSSGLKLGEGSLDERLLFRELSHALAIAEFRQEEERAGELETALSRMLFLNCKLNVLEKLRASKGSVSIESVEQYRNSEYCLLHIDYAQQLTRIYTFGTDCADEANARYAELEREKQLMEDVLLVSVSSLKNLREAYPNYSADIGLFLDRVDSLVEWVKEKRHLIG